MLNLPKLRCFISLIITLVVLSPASAQIDSVSVSTPVHGHFIFVHPGRGQLTLIDTFTGDFRILITDDTGIESPVWSPRGDALAFHAGVTSNKQNVILDLTTGTSETISALEHFTTWPIGWNADQTNLFYVQYTLNEHYRTVYTFELFDQVSNTLATVTSFTSGDVLDNLPYPLEPGNFMFYPQLMVPQIIRNPVHDQWLALLVQGLDTNLVPSLSVADGIPQEAFLDEVILWNYETGQMLSVASVLSSDIDISRPISWSANGRYLAVHSTGEEGGLTIIELRYNDNQWSIMVSEHVRDIGSYVIQDWLGAGDLLIARQSNLNTKDAILHIGQIINGNWFSTEFLRLSFEQFGSIGTESWYITASEDEKNQLTCLFDHSLPTRLEVGVRAHVVFSDSVANHLRNAPGLEKEQIALIPEGAEFEVTTGPACNDGFRWWQVELDDSATGWTAEANSQRYFIEPPHATEAS